MKIKLGIYSFCFLLIALLASCGASKKVTYIQSEVSRKGKVVDLPSHRKENFIRFQPDDILGITVNVPGEPAVAADYNLPLIPLGNTENSTDYVSTGMGRQTFLIKKDSTIDFPVVGIIKVAGYTQDELENYIKERLTEKLKAPAIVTVRLLNFTITFAGEVNRPGPITVSKDHINLLEALALAGDLSINGKRDDIRVLRPTEDGYKEISLNISKESVISSPYYYLHQNDYVYVPPISQRTQSADVSPRWSSSVGIYSFVVSVITFILMITKK